MDARFAEPWDVDRLATIWYDGWQDAHALLLPPALSRDRTRESFHTRLTAALGELRVVGPVGEPLGFCLTKGNELNQLYVSAEARGTGAAATLVTDAETRMATSGVQVAWLACAIGNMRAARFYEKCGWRRAATVTLPHTTAEGEVLLEVWRYEKELAPGG